MICDDGGIILDDGTISRLDDDRYFVTTTTGNADAIESWFRWWLAGRPNWDVTLTNVTGSYAAMNLAGPTSREILARLITGRSLDCGFPYLAVGRSEIVGVPAIVLRIGFVGELGYEIHVPAQHGLYVWERISRPGSRLACSRLAWRRSGACGWTKSTSWSAPTPMRSPTRSRPTCRGSSSSTRPDFIGKRTLQSVADARPAEPAGRLHARRRVRAHRGGGDR